MIHYIAKRLLLMIPTLLGITLVTFLVMKLAPGDPIMLKLKFAGDKISPEALAALIQSEKPVIELSPGYLAAARKTAALLHGVPEDRTEGTKTFGAFKWTGENAVLYAKWIGGLVPFEWKPEDFRAAVADASAQPGIRGALSYAASPFAAVLRWPGFGLSQKDKRSVMEKIREKLPVTLLINVVTILVVYSVSIPLGIWSAVKRGTFADKVVMVKLFVLYSLPTFWVATVLLVVFAGGDYLDLFPLAGIVSDYHDELGFFGRVADTAWHLALPVLADTAGSFAFLSRFSRNNFLEVVRQDYIRTARAKGLPEGKVLYKHGLRNALIPFVTLMGTLLPALLGGSVVIEQIFSIPGMGMLSFEAVLGRDHNVIMGIATIGAFLTLVSLFLSDLLYTAVDPRISLK